MQKRMKLKGRIRLDDDNSMYFSSTLHDKTGFSLLVTQYDVELNDSFTDKEKTVDGWLYVTQEAQQDSRCYLTLPKPVLIYGKQIVVHEHQLLAQGLTIENFIRQPVGTVIHGKPLSE